MKVFFDGNTISTMNYKTIVTIWFFFKRSFSLSNVHHSFSKLSWEIIIKRRNCNKKKLITSLIHLKGHLNNYLNINGKYLTYYLLFIKGWSHLGPFTINGAKTIVDYVLNCTYITLKNHH
jgi:hypothetical protein